MVLQCIKMPQILNTNDHDQSINITEFNSRFVNDPDPNNFDEFKQNVYLDKKFDAWKEAFMYILLKYHKIFELNQSTSQKVI